MDIDTELRARFDQLATSLKDHATGVVADTARDLAARVDAERSRAVADAALAARTAAEHDADKRLEAALADASGKIVDAEARGKESGRLQGRDEGLRDGLTQGRKEGRDEALREALDRARAAGERLAGSVRYIGAARSLTDILDTLAACAAHEVPRVALLLVEGNRLRGWRFCGFEPDIPDQSAFGIAIEDAGIIGQAVRSGAAISADSAGEGTVPPFAATRNLAEPFAVPLLVDGQAVGVLYADRGPERRADAAETPWRAALEILTGHAGRSLESVAAFRAAQAATTPRRARPDARAT